MAWQSTHERIQREALRLFGERGFDDVTVEEVSKAAGVSHMTFFRHFPTKESVILDDPFDPRIGSAVADQDTDLAPLARACRGIRAAWADIDIPDDHPLRQRLRLAASHPGLRARARENNHRTEQVIADALTQTGAPPLEAKIAAGAVLGALTAVLFAWAESDDAGGLGEAIHTALGILHASEASV
jgi:AcrR family transcriptional regulator